MIKDQSVSQITYILHILFVVILLKTSTTKIVERMQLNVI